MIKSPSYKTYILSPHESQILVKDSMSLVCICRVEISQDKEDTGVSKDLEALCPQ